MTTKPAATGCDDETLGLLQRAQGGDRAALQELRDRGQTGAIENWSETILLIRLQDRAGETNLLARSAVAHDIAKAEASLARPDDGPIERLLARRAAWCAVDADLADREHVCGIVGGETSHAVAELDRRRDRAHRRLLSTLKALTDCRRPVRAAVQVNVGNQVLGIIKS